MRANTSRALRESKWNRNLPCNVAARGRQTCRRRESLGTDSRVLRGVRPFNTAINAFAANFFLPRGVDCAGDIVREKNSRKISPSCRILSPWQKL
jgi:hypothetical protein